MQGQWVRESTNATTIVFVHGVLSSGDTCWKNENGNTWPGLLMNNIDLADIGIYVFTYQTGFFSGTYSLSNVVDALKEWLKLDGIYEQRRIIFVCHSMGGIVVRKFIVERVNDLIDRNIEIGLFLVASPSLGAEYANWLSPLAKLLDHSQAEALRFAQSNTWLNDLDKEFQNLKESGRLKIKGKELIEDKFVISKSLFVVFRWKQLVEPFSGARYFGEPFKVPQSDHFSIAKPDNEKAIQHRILCQFIKEALKPAPLEAAEIMQIVRELNRQIQNKPEDRLQIIQIFYSKYVNERKGEVADLILTIKSMVTTTPANNS